MSYRRLFIASQTAALLCYLFLSSAQITSAAYTLDRWYQMGDDILFDGGASQEGAVNGAEVGSGSTLTGLDGAPITYDSAATNNDNFQPLAAFSSGGGTLATYVEYGVGGNPSAPVAGAASMNSFGIQFDGTSDYLRAVNLNNPSVAAPTSLVTYDTEDRGMQMWAYPMYTDPNGIDELPRVIDDGDEHEIRLLNTGEWQFEIRDNVVSSGVDATLNGWTHLMWVRNTDVYNGAIGYVNGLAVASNTPGYVTGAGTNLLVGANAEDDGGTTADPNTLGNSGFFTGIIDEIEIFVTDDDPNTTSFGRFDYTEDNGYFTDVFLPTQSGYGFTLDPNTGHNSETWVDGDINFDGVLDSGDVTAFVAGWRSDRAGPNAGDYATLMNGDLDLDGDTDLKDWFVLRSLNPTLTVTLGELLAGVPEPSTALLCVSSLLACSLARRRTS